MNVEKIIVGLDPGASGGIAWTKPGVGVVAVAMPGDFDAIAALVQEIEDVAAPEPEGVCRRRTERLAVVVYCELVTGYVAPQKADLEAEDGERVNRQPGHAMFTFGKNTGAAIMAFKMVGAEVIEVPPKTWQAPLFVKKGGSSKPEWKRTLKSIAQRKFPGVKVTLKTADALLLLWFGTLKETAGSVIVPGNPQNDASGQRRAGNRPDSQRVRETLHVAPWKGETWVFRKTPEGKTFVARKASIDDMRTLPTL